MSEIGKLLDIMARLRDPRNGCPWDIEQTFRTIAPYTVEEAYEVADAIEREEPARLCDELGDLLFQVVFHARMAEEAGHFDFGDVVSAISAKLVRRHPHVFGGAEVGSAAAQRVAWEEHKAAERRAQPGRGLLEDVPVALPALRRADKLTRRAATVGFDWPDTAAIDAKLGEELRELESELEPPDGGAPDPARVADELGDVLFVLCNLARHLHVDPEAALQGSNAKFVRRFEYIERQLAGRDGGLEDAPLAEMDRLWNAAKRELG